MTFRTTVSTLALTAAIAAVPLSTHAAAITSGDVLIYRVGTGAAALGTTAAAVFLDEYSPSGSLVQSIAVDSASATGAVTAVGTATSEGIITASTDGTKLIFTGYRTAAGTAAPTATTVTRSIASVDVTGTVDSSSIGYTSTTTSTVRSATTNGTNYYVSTSALVGYLTTPSAAATATTIDARNSREVLLANVGGAANTLTASNGSTAITPKVQSYGVLPTTLTTPTAIATLALGDAVNGYVLEDLSPTVAGADTLYALSVVESLLRKYTFDGTNWTASGSVSSAALNVTAGITGTSVSLFLTSGSTLSRLNDLSGYGGTLTGTTTAVATAATNTAFRGIGDFNAAYSLIPEPTTLVALAGLGFVGVARRRKA